MLAETVGAPLVDEVGVNGMSVYALQPTNPDVSNVGAFGLVHARKTQKNDGCQLMPVQLGVSEHALWHAKTLVGEVLDIQGQLLWSSTRSAPHDTHVPRCGTRMPGTSQQTALASEHGRSCAVFQGDTSPTLTHCSVQALNKQPLPEGSFGAHSDCPLEETMYCVLLPSDHCQLELVRLLVAPVLMLFKPIQ